MRQVPGLHTCLASSVCVHVRVREPEKKAHRKGDKQSREEQGSRGAETMGWDLSVAAPFTNRRGSIENTIDLCPHGLSSGGSSLLGPAVLTPLWASGQLQ